MSASLVKQLLIRAGIETNPGPYFCSVCKIKLHSNTTSVQCKRCNEWVHFRKTNNCSGLKTIRDYNANFTCLSCKNDPLQQNPNHPPPTSTQPNLSNHYDLKILQLNINGIKNKLTELTNFIYNHNIKVVVLQETKLSPNSNTPSIPNFTLIRRDREKEGGGLAIFIHKSIQFTDIPNIHTDNHTEAIAIEIGNISLINIYIPPTSSCESGYQPTLQPYFSHGDALILGDINAHDQLWHSRIQDSRGQLLAEEILDSNLGVMNEDVPTRLPSNNQPTSPDISLASHSLLPHAKWETVTSLGSDHLPIIITISTNIKPSYSENRKYINFNKADWKTFQEETEKEFSNLNTPSNVHKAEVTFRSIINKVAKRTIPGGRIKETIPEIPTETLDKIYKRDEIRSRDPTSPEIEQLNREIISEANVHRRDKWREKVNNISCSSKLYKLVKALQGKTVNNENQAIKFKGKYISGPKNLANAFNKQYCSVVRHITSKDTRRIWKENKKNTLDDNSTVFTANQTKEAIKSSKPSKAIGPDKISNLHLKHLGPKGLEYLTQIYNISMKTSGIPDIWKTSTIVPLLKPGKPSDESNSYRPVSLLCPAIKILERLILPTLTETLPVPDFQHGFRKMHSTVTALNEFTEDVASGFNQLRPPKRTVLLQLDLSKAFDMVNIDKLLDDLNHSNLPSGMKRWLCCYLKGRQAKVCFRNEFSSHRNIKSGVPQGAVTSPLLFNFYLANLPRPPDGMKIIQYADDISIYASGLDIDKMTKDITNFAKTITNFLKGRELVVSAEKSTVTLFTPDTKEAKVHPQVQVDGKVVPFEPTPKLLGVTFDTMFTFSHHVKKTVSKTKSKINIMKSLAGSTWGQDKETMLLTYKSIGRSVLEYAVPVWGPMISESNWNKIQTTQNQALRLATGNLKMADQDHLHIETKVLPAKKHAEMISNQFLLNCHSPGHPGNKQVQYPTPPRNMKHTIQRNKQKIHTLLPISDKKDYKRKAKILHTKAVQESVQNYNNNKVLNRKPPEISKEEISLSRTTRSQLSQLRSGYSRILKSYQHRLNPEIEDKCPKCHMPAHTTNHLFNCPSEPTNLMTLDLWKKPKAVADFLKLEDGIT